MQAVRLFAALWLLTTLVSTVVARVDDLGRPSLDRRGLQAPVADDPSDVSVNTTCVRRALGPMTSGCYGLNLETTAGNPSQLRVALSSMLHACVTFNNDSTVRPLRVLAGSARLYTQLQRLGDLYAAAAGRPPLHWALASRLGSVGAAVRAALAAPPPVRDTPDASGGYDAIIATPAFLHLADEAGKLADLSGLVADDTQLGWYGISAALREHMLVYGNKVVAMPLVTSPAFLFYHARVFDRDGLQPPAAWDGLLALAERYHGTDLNGDGQPDFGVCLTPPNCFVDGVLLQWLLASLVQTRGSGQGMFLDPASMANLANTTAMAEALELLRRLRALGPLTGDCSVFEDRHFLAGRCLLSLTSAATLKAAYSPDTPPAFTTLRGGLGVAPFPGSTRVLDRGSGAMAPCDAARCPLARREERDASGVLRPVNAPLPSTNTIVILNAQSPPHYAFYAYTLLSFLVSPGVLGAGGGAGLLLDPRLETAPLRQADLAAGAEALWVAAGYHPRDVAAYFAAYREAFANPNQAFDASFPGNINVSSAARLAAALYTNATPGHRRPPLAAAQAIVAAAVQDVTAAAGFAAAYRRSLNWRPPPPPPPPSSTLLAAAPGSGGSGGGGSRAHRTVAVAVAVPCGVAALGLVGVVAWAGRRRGRRRRGQLAAAPPGAGPDTTILVTDIQSSTALWEALPAPVMDAALRTHHSALRRAIAEWGGYESATEGDSFIVAFRDPTAALMCALAAQQALLDAPWPPALLDAAPPPGLGAAAGPLAEVVAERVGPPRPDRGRAVRRRGGGGRDGSGGGGGQDGRDAGLVGARTASPALDTADSGAAAFAPGGALGLSSAAAEPLQTRPAAGGASHGGPARASPPPCPSPHDWRSPPASLSSLGTPRLALLAAAAAAAAASPFSSASAPAVAQVAAAAAAAADEAAAGELRGAAAPRARLPRRHAGGPAAGGEEGEGGPEAAAGEGAATSLTFADALLREWRIHARCPGGACGGDGGAVPNPNAHPSRSPSGAPSPAPWLPSPPPAAPAPATISTNMGTRAPEPPGEPLSPPAAAGPRPGSGAVAARAVLFRGLRVRMGMATGVPYDTDVCVNAASGRVQYGGECMRRARAVSDTAHGGMVVLPEGSRARLDPDAVRRSRPYLLYMGHHVVGAKAAAAAVGGGGGSAVCSTAEQAEHLYCAYGAGLLPRAVVVRPVAGGGELRPGLLAAPVGYGAVVQVRVVGAGALLAWDAPLAAAALAVLHAAALRLLPPGADAAYVAAGAVSLAPGAGAGSGRTAGEPLRSRSSRSLSVALSGLGLVVPEGGGPAGGTSRGMSASSRGAGAGAMSVVFADADAAVSWAAALRRAGPLLDWPAGLLAHELCEEVWAEAPQGAGFGDFFVLTAAASAGRARRGPRPRASAPGTALPGSYSRPSSSPSVALPSTARQSLEGVRPRSPASLAATSAAAAAAGLATSSGGDPLPAHAALASGVGSDADAAYARESGGGGGGPDVSGLLGRASVRCGGAAAASPRHRHGHGHASPARPSSRASRVSPWPVSGEDSLRDCREVTTTAEPDPCTDTSDTAGLPAAALYAGRYGDGGGASPVPGASSSAGGGGSEAPCARLLFRGLRLRAAVAAGPLGGRLAAGDVSGQLSYRGGAAAAAAKLMARARAGQICATPDLARGLLPCNCAELTIVGK